MGYREPKDTLRYRILTYLDKNGPSSISELSRNVGSTLSEIRDKLGTAERNGHIIRERRRQLGAYGEPQLIHASEITEKGRQWLKAAEQS